MRNVVLVAALAAACSRTDKRTESPSPAVAPPIASATPVMLFGQVPTTSSYRVIACTLGAEERYRCDRLLASLVGTEVHGADGKAAKVAKVGSHQASDGKAPIVELDAPLGTAVVTGSVALVHTAATLTDAETKTLRTKVRAISPRARWATTERFEVRALEADLDGDHVADRVAIGTIVDAQRDATRVVVGVAVAIAGSPFELVSMDADRVQLVGSIDLDGDGRAEVLIDRTFAGDATNYHYELMRVLPGKPLAMDLATIGSVSAGWQAYDQLVDQPRDEL